MLRLLTKGGGRVGNAILYGGDDGMIDLASMIGQVGEPKDIYYVETDFGNHMHLTWDEVQEMFYINGVQSYDRWKEERARLQQEPNLIEQREQRNSLDFPPSFHASR